MSSSDLRDVRRALAGWSLSIAGLAAWLGSAAAALAASPAPTAAAGGDPRSSGQGPGLVGDPLVAIGVVAAIGILSLGATLLYVRATGGSRGS